MSKEGNPRSAINKWSEKYIQRARRRAAMRGLGVNFDRSPSYRYYEEQAALYPELTQQEATIFFQALETGSTLEEIQAEIKKLHTQTLTHLKQEEIERRSKFLQLFGASSQIKEAIALCNLKLVVLLAYGTSGLPFEDRVQSGNIGLLKAIEKFDYKKGYTFSTYAVPWIVQRILRDGLETGYIIRLPVHLQEKLDQIENEKGEITTRAERNKKPLRVTRYTNAVQRYGLRHVKSLNTPITKGAEDLRTLEDIIPDKTDPFREVEATPNPINERLREKIAQLPPRQQQALLLYFGLEENPEIKGKITYQKIGALFGVTREMIRQDVDAGIAILAEDPELEGLFTVNSDDEYTYEADLVKQTKDGIKWRRLTPKEEVILKLYYREGSIPSVVRDRVMALYNLSAAEFSQTVSVALRKLESD